MCCLLLPHSTYFNRQFLVLVLFVGYCFGEIMYIWDSCVYQKVFFVFLFIKVMSGRLKGIVLSYAAIPAKFEIFILQYTGWCVLIIWTFIVNQFGCFCQFIIILLLLLLPLLTAIELSLDGSSPYTSTVKTNKNKCT